MNMMTVDELEECLSVLAGVRRRSGDRPADAAVARLLGRPIGVVKAYRTGTAPLPDDLVGWLRRRAEYRKANPPPVLDDLSEIRSQRRVVVSAEEARERSERLMFAMQPLRWNAPFLASLVRRSPETVRRWMLGVSGQAVPEPLVAWVEKAQRLGGHEKAGPVPQLDGPTDAEVRNAEKLAARLREAMERLDWTIAAVAQQADRTYQGARLWTLGKVCPPEVFVKWMEGLANAEAADPAPVWVLPGGVRPAELARGLELLRSAGLVHVAKLLERATEVDEAA